MISSLMAVALAALWPQGASAGEDIAMRTELASPSGVAALYAHLPLSFEINQGQADSAVKYLAHGRGYTLWLTADQAVLVLRSSAQRSTSALPVVRLRLVGSDPDPRVRGEQPLPGQSNYFLGNNPQAWHTGIPTFAQVRYHDVYRGVDLVYYGRQGQLEYDFVVQPGADLRSIQFAIDSGEQIPVPLRIDGNGDLVVGTEGGEVAFHKPLVYQPTTDYEPGTKSQEPRTTNRKVIDGKYVLKGRRVTFAVGSYDRRQPLVIDPVLIYSTYLGGTGGDVANGIAVDSSGNAYITGQTGSVDFPIVSA